MDCALGVTSENSLIDQRPLRFFFFSKCFAFYIRSMICVELFFVKGIRSVSRLIFYMGMSRYSLCRLNLGLGSKAIFSMNVCHLFPQCMSAIISLLCGLTDVVVTSPCLEN